MDVDAACEFINHQLIYKPGWEFTAKNHTRRYEGTLMVHIEYPARNSDEEEAPDYPNEIRPYAKFPIPVGDCTSEGLLRRMMDTIISIETHEAREFLRHRPTREFPWYRAPFHPHRMDGMITFHGGVEGIDTDLKFGLA